MKIIDVKVDEFFTENYTIKDSEGHSHPGVKSDGKQFLVRVIADNGLEGHYFSQSMYLKPNEKFNVPKDAVNKIHTRGYSQAEILRSAVKPMIIGEDPLSREKIFNKISQMQRLNFAISEKTLAYIDCALWDLAGKAAGVPVYKLLGGHRTKIKAYASTMVGDHYEGGLDTAEAYARFAKECKIKGFKAYKLHTWAEIPWEENTIRAKGNWKRDVEACHSVRQEAGDDMELMLDCYHYYDRYDALNIGKELEKANYAWLEEPMDEYNVSSYKWLCDNLDIPVCGPEVALGKLQTRAEWIVRGSCDIARTGAFDVGGLTPALKTAHLCEAFGIPLEIHSPGPCNIHLLASMIIPGEYYEYGLLHPFLDYTTPPWLNKQVDEMDSDGNILVPQTPGMGWDINYDYIKDNLVKL